MVGTGGSEVDFWDLCSVQSSSKTSEHDGSAGRDGRPDPARPTSASIADDMVPEPRRAPRLGRGLGRGLVPPAIEDEDERNFWHTVILNVRTGIVFGRLSIKFWTIWGEEVYKRVVSVAANIGPSKDPVRERLMSCEKHQFVH